VSVPQLGEGAPEGLDLPEQGGLGHLEPREALGRRVELLPRLGERGAARPTRAREAGPERPGPVPRPADRVTREPCATPAVAGATGASDSCG
jgi:hypothetical protein